MSMSISLNKICCNSLFPLSSAHHQNWDECRRTSNIEIQSHYVRNSVLPHLKNTRNYHHRFALHSINGGDDTAHDLSDSQSYSAEPQGSVEGKDGHEERSLSTTKLGRILEQLKRYGASGVLSYGLLNTAYYLTTFLLVWFYFAPAPGKMGYLAAVSRFLKVMAMVWAGSQVTKIIRAAGALALAPLVDRGLSWFTVRYKFESRGKAFFTIVAFCLSLAAIMFIAVTLLSA
ncbi:hypothetical protein SOVF_113710 isoform A [Spinacia oleracea]|uniref:Gag-Pol polyprotein/retrotransposon n=1 Tax=Spinacia oleracea TaxID=3562 RepID=A0A9R0I9B0_SPIOL|nr:uncharacterized protein LOC110783799 [Spinacia oleracea]KNA13777.1 hypothetical protein SOVF_113710 isoform A [Spinacia oleracea]